MGWGQQRAPTGDHRSGLAEEKILAERYRTGVYLLMGFLKSPKGEELKAPLRHPEEVVGFSLCWILHKCSWSLHTASRFMNHSKCGLINVWAGMMPYDCCEYRCQSRQMQGLHPERAHVPEPDTCVETCLCSPPAVRLQVASTDAKSRGKFL